MQPDPVDTTNMISVDDHGWDEQAQYESDKHKDNLVLLKQSLELVPMEEPLDIHDQLEQWCKLLERLLEQEISVSLQREWGLQPLPDDRPLFRGRALLAVLTSLHQKFLLDIPPSNHDPTVNSSTEANRVPLLDHLTANQSQDERKLVLLKQSLELVPKKKRLDIHDQLEQWCEQQLERLRVQGIIAWLQRECGLQPLPDDRPLFRSQIDPTSFLQSLQHRLRLCVQRAYLLVGADTNNVFPSIYVPNSSVRVQAQGLHTKMLEKIQTTVGSVGCTKSLFTVRTSLLNDPGEEGSDIPRSNHDPTVTSSIEANRVPLLDHLTANQSQDKSITTNPRQGEKGFVLHSADAKANPVIKNISVITRAGSGGSSSEGTGSALTRGNDHHSSNDMPLVIFDNQAQVNCTGDFSVLSNPRIGPENIVLVAANGAQMETFMSGSVNVGNFELHEVHYCPDLGNRVIVSGSKLDKDDYGYECRQGKLTVKDLKKNDTTVGEGHLVDGNYVLDYLKIPRIRPDQPRLVTTLWNAVCSALHRLGLRY